MVSVTKRSSSSDFIIKSHAGSEKTPCMTAPITVFAPRSSARIHKAKPHAATGADWWRVRELQALPKAAFSSLTSILRIADFDLVNGLLYCVASVGLKLRNWTQPWWNPNPIWMP
mmetsp:Transcript_855/g.1821  ORF Transcript_855/g.1821 Transcript_855/m.1821 type:complete len:115 (+) Transcript_855:295-639(+)